MRWVVLSALALVVGCSESSDSGAAAPPFTAPAQPATPGQQVAPGGDVPGAGEGVAVDPTAPASTPGGASEDPASGITGGVEGVAPAETGSSSAGASGAPPVEQPPAGAPGEVAPPVSAGCGTGAGVAGEFSIPLNGANAAFTITLPPGYDPNTPTPLIFGFHGRNQTHIQFRTQDASNIQTELGSRAVMAYLKSQAGPGWNFAEEVEPNVAFFDAVYARMLADFCVDTSRIFAVGHSSGGYFANILACRYGDQLRAIGSVAGNTQEFDCVGRVAALVVHGVRDAVVSFAGGQESRDLYLAANGCENTSLPNAVTPCVDYQGCDAGLPVTWCEHSEPTYDNTNHGWPSFASRALGQFLFALGPKGE